MYSASGGNLKIKFLLALVMFLGCFYQLYETVFKRKYLQPRVSRNIKGFVIDHQPVPIVVSEETLKAYQDFMSGAGSEVQNTITDSPTQPGDVPTVNQQPADKNSQSLLSPGAPPPKADRAETNSASNVPGEMSGEQELPSLPGEAPLEAKQESQSQVEKKLEIPEEIPPASEDENLAERKLQNSETDKVPNANDTAGKPPLKLLKVPAKQKLSSCDTKNSESRIPKEVWQAKLKEAGVTSYKIENVISLPEVSVQVFGEESCWPKIWSLNPHIGNPYDLAIGDEIQFVHKKERAPASQ